MNFRGSIALAGAIAAIAVFSSGALRAQSPRIVVAVTPAADFGSGFVSVTDGLFAKRGLDVEFKMVTVNSMIPAMLVSESMQIGGATVPVLLQAADSGVDLVAIAGSGVADNKLDVFGTVMKADIPFSKPEDYIGKKIGVPGIGAFLDVLFRHWLIEKGVDPKKMTFVEAGFPAMSDMVKNGTVDGVVTAEPFMARMIEQKIAKLTTRFAEALTGEVPIIVYSSTRKWANANPAAVKAFREALAEGTVIANRRDAQVRAAVGKYLPMPPDLINSMKLGNWNDKVTEAGLASWVSIMKRQGLLANSLDVSKLLLK